MSDGVPSSTFLKAAGIWNAGKSSTGAANVGLPVPDVQVTTGPVTLGQPIPLVDIALPVGTRLEILQADVGPVLTGKVKVVDGPHTGIIGEVSAAELRTSPTSGPDLSRPGRPGPRRGGRGR